MTTTLDVTTFGADPSGVADSTDGINLGITVAQQQGPGTVLAFPAGTYICQRGIGDTPGAGIVVQGAGRGLTEVFQTGSGQLLRMNSDAVVVAGMTLDTLTRSRGQAALIVNGSGCTVENIGIAAADYYGLRFNRPNVAQTVGEMRSQPLLAAQLAQFGRGNVLHDAVIRKDGIRADDAALDIDFQLGFRGSQIQLTGSIMAIYIGADIGIDGFSYTPGLDAAGAERPGQHGWNITAPSDTVTLSNFTSTGDAGRIGAAGKWPHRRSTNVTLVNHVMPATRTLGIGDAIGLTINDSQLGVVFLGPTYTLSNVSARRTTIAALHQAARSSASLTDIHLPGLDIGGLPVTPDAPGWQGSTAPSNGGGGSVLPLVGAGAAIGALAWYGSRHGSHGQAQRPRHQAQPRRRYL